MARQLGRLREEARRQVSHTSFVDWRAWGDDARSALDNFKAAMVLGWPQHERQIKRVGYVPLVTDRQQYLTIFEALQDLAHDLPPPGR